MCDIDDFFAEFEDDPEARKALEEGRQWLNDIKEELGEAGYNKWIAEQFTAVTRITGVTKMEGE